MACALNKGVEIHTLLPEGNEKQDLIFFLQNNKKYIKRYLQKKLREKKALKWYLTLQVKFVKINNSDEKVEGKPYFRNKCISTFHKSEINKQIESAFAYLLNKFGEWMRDGSGWILEQVISLDISIAKFRPIKGNTYVDLPKHLKKKRAIINVKNNDDFCFVWSVLAALYPPKFHAERIEQYRKHFNELNISGINFPMQIGDIHKFERKNDLCINVYEYKKENVYPLYISKLKDFEGKKKIHLLLIKKDNVYHYCLVKNLSRLFREQGKHSNKKYYCDFCLHGFTTSKLLETHNYLCKKQEPQKVKLPKEEKKFLEFKNFYKQDKIKFVIYCDFESILKPIQGCKPDPSFNSSTTTTHIHEPCAFSYYVCSSIKEYEKPPVVYRGENVVETFINCMLEEEDRILDVLFKYTPLKMSEQDWKLFLESSKCHICGKEVKENELRVRDHEHSSGKFRGLAHVDCNLRFKKTKRIPIVFHNLKNYDAHLIMQAIGKVGKDKITCIPTNMEKYISFTLGKYLIFIDSFQFLSSSLQSLVDNLANEGLHGFNHLTNHILNIDPNLLLRKQVYPYEYIDSWEKLKENKLPKKESFYSSLTEEGISYDDYKHVTLIWKEGKFSSLGELCDFYVKTDTLLLACVFENFRTLCLDYYKLDPLYYVSLPGLTFEACLRYTNVRLELLTDIDKYLFFESGIRGGISGIFTRYGRANNPNLEDYNPKKPTSYIAFYDCNGLYAWALSQSLPIGNFEWLDDKSISDLDIMNLGKDGVGYVLEVDLKYPRKLHDLHNQYPLAPEKLKVENDMISPYLRNLLDIHSLKHSNKTEKLIPNLSDKEKYIVHYKALQLYLSLGLELKKIHRVISFNESNWIEPYVLFNTEKRKNAKSVFEQNFFKLLLNSLYGKTMENVRKRKRVELVTDENQLTKLVSKPTFNNFKIFNENLVGVDMKKVEVTLDKPIYIGFCILDISKVVMYDFHYNHILKKYGSNAILLFSDTDSLCYLKFIEDLHKKMFEDIEIFDTSNYPRDHFLYRIERKKGLGYFKDEMGGKIIKEFVGLRAKMYSILTEDENKKTAKGVKKTTINKHLRHNEYLRALKEGIRYSHNMTSIRSKDHIIYTCDLKKTTICPLDDKRYILKNGINSLAYNHYRIDVLKKKYNYGK